MLSIDSDLHVVAARVGDNGSDRRSSDHAYLGYGLEATARIIDTMMGVNGAVQFPDLQFQSSDLIDNGLQRRGQDVRRDAHVHQAAMSARDRKAYRSRVG